MICVVRTVSLTDSLMMRGRCAWGHLLLTMTLRIGQLLLVIYRRNWHANYVFVCEISQLVAFQTYSMTISTIMFAVLCHLRYAQASCIKITNTKIWVTSYQIEQSYASRNAVLRRKYVIHASHFERSWIWSASPCIDSFLQRTPPNLEKNENYI